VSGFLGESAARTGLYSSALPRLLTEPDFLACRGTSISVAFRPAKKSVSALRVTIPFAALVVALAGCDEASPDKAADTVSDTVLDGDTGGVPSADVVTGDTSSDAMGDPESKACTFKQPQLAAVDSKRSKFAMALFHFNVEYVIGGLEAKDPSGKTLFFMDNPKNAGWSDEKTEDYIVRETLLPILAMYDKHPGWGVDIEMQGRMVEVMAARHPDVIELLRKLAQRGQVEVISFHHSAQFFLAFPKEDLVRSIGRVKEVFAKHCLPLGKAVFDQEGQAGEGRQKVLVQQGYQIGVFPKNLWKYQHKDLEPWWPLYSSEGGDLIVGPGSVDPKSGIEVAWSFFDDGELRAVADKPFQLNPYFAPTAPHLPERVKAFEDQLAAMEAQGWAHVTVEDYVRHVKAKGIAAKPAPPLLDGTWQAPSTQSVRQWMGRIGLWMDTEADNTVRSMTAVASIYVRLAQVLLELAEKAGKATPDHTVAVHDLWTGLWRAQVSDTTGINPWAGEVWFGLRTIGQVVKDATKVTGALLKALAPTASSIVDLQTRQFTNTADNVKLDSGADVPLPLAVTVEAPGRTVTVTARQQAEARFSILVKASKPADPTDRTIAVRFPRTGSEISYSPGLLEGELRTYPLSAFQFLLDEAYLPLANGLIGLGDDWWLVKSTAWVHVAARISPKDSFIEFRDDTVNADFTKSTVEWRFALVKGKGAAALEYANRLNIWPTIQPSLGGE
jgi:hypothetical protein